MTNKKLRAVALILATLASSAALAEVKYTLTNTIVGFNAWAINESGQIAGWGTEDELAKLYTPGLGIANIPTPEGVAGSYAYTLNEKGQVAGQLSYRGSYEGQKYQGFIYTPDPNGAIELEAQRISIGWALSESGSAYQLPGVFPSWSVGPGVATSISTNGYTAGYSKFNTRNDYGMAWLRNPDGTFVTIGLDLEASQSMAFGVNDSGIVVGRAIPDNYGATYAFGYLQDTGEINLFDATEATSRTGWSRFISAQDITNDGRIVGWGVYAGNGISRISSFVLTPLHTVPEPDTLVLSLGALTILASLVYRRNQRR